MDCAALWTALGLASDLAYACYRSYSKDKVMACVCMLPNGFSSCPFHQLLKGRLQLSLIE